MSSSFECIAMATLLPLLVILTTCSGHTIRYVKPTPDTSCPADPCLTLSEYAQQPHHYLTSNTTLLLLPGDHVLGVNFTVENVSEFEIHALSSSPHAVKIICQQLVGFTFRNISHMTLLGLTFTSCGKGSYSTVYGVSIHLGQDTEIADCSFQGSIRTALGVFYSSLVLRGSNIFTNSCATCSGSSCICLQLGGGIFTKTSTLVFTGNSTFRGNTAKFGGGIFAYNSSLTFNGDSIFSDNSAKFGGGIEAMFSTLSFVGNSTFSSNSANIHGGGIDTTHSTLIFSGNNTFRNNFAGPYGGGINAEHTTLKFTGNNTFRNNSAKKDGGGIIAEHSTLKLTGNNTFRNNSAEKDGGGLNALYSTLTFTGNNTFINNSADRDSGGINARYSTLKFAGYNSFKSNSAGRDGAGAYALNCTLNFTGKTTIRENSAKGNGGGINAVYSTLNFTGNSRFIENSVERYGGGMFIWYSTLKFTSNSTFRNNTAERDGGGTYASHSALDFTGISSFRHNSARNFGGGIRTTFQTILKFSGNSNVDNSCNLDFMDNSALIHGGAVHAEDSTLRFEGFNTFSGNSARYYGGGVYSENSTLTFSGNTDFRSNSGWLQGGGIYGLGTSLYFSGNSSFTANTAVRGGGEYLADSFNFLSRNATFTMDSNSATEYGGAVYAEDPDPVSYCFPAISDLKKCFFQIHGSIENIPIVVLSSTAGSVVINAYFNIHINMYDNNARVAGSAVFGGSLDSCFSQVHFDSENHEGIILVDLFALNLDLEPNTVSSDPFQVCMCEYGIPNCNTSEVVRQVYPGELLHFPVVAAGQREGIVPATVRAFFTDTNKNTSLAQYQDTQNVRIDCTDLYYQIQSPATNSSDMLKLYADGPCSTDGRLLNISLQFLPCPPGFSLTL